MTARVSAGSGWRFLRHPHIRVDNKGDSAIIDVSISGLIQRRGIDLQLQQLHLILYSFPKSIMQTGTIARLTDKGFGFIKIEGQSRDLFFHSNELQGVSFDALQEGDTLSFEIAEGPKGPNAIKISKA